MQILPFSSNILNVASTCLEIIHKARHPKAVFLFSWTDHEVVGVQTKKYGQLLRNHPNNFLGIYDSQATVDWLCEDVQCMFRINGLKNDEHVENRPDAGLA